MIIIMITILIGGPRHCFGIPQVSDVLASHKDSWVHSLRGLTSAGGAILAGVLSSL